MEAKCGDNIPYVSILLSYSAVAALHVDLTRPTSIVWVYVLIVHIKTLKEAMKDQEKLLTSKSVDSIQRSRFFSDSNLPRLLECWAQVRTLLLLWEKKTIGSKLGYGKILRQQLLKSWTQFIFITEIDKSVRVVRGLQILAPKSNERITLSVDSIFLKQARVSTKNYRRSRKNNANVQVNLCRYHAL